MSQKIPSYSSIIKTKPFKIISLQPENCIKRGIQDGKKSNRETSNINCSNRFEVLSTTDADDDDENTSQSSKSGNATTSEFVGNTAKGRNSKRVFQENKARQIFRKTSIFYSLIRTRTCVSQGVKNVCFSENLACFGRVFVRE